MCKRPEVRTLEALREVSDKSFSADAMVAGDCIASGTGKSKREAEQVAARSAYDILKPQVVDEGN